jgi:2-polyprenyl-6-methoxyphenol hydroxylase-like FAD-dependent oxidoreductase
VVADDDGVTVHLAATDTGASSTVCAQAVVGADGIHSAIRRQFYPGEGLPRYSGVNMWRGVTRWPPILDGATMILAGCLATGQTVIYPIRDKIDAEGRQLVNWVFEMETPKYQLQDWNREGRYEDFLPVVSEWHFEWLDVPTFLRQADAVLEFPMVDRDPLPRWSFGCVTLLGDAAHPMVPRGSNGAGQAILDAVTLAECLAKNSVIESGFAEYERLRREQTSRIVLANRATAPDAMLNEVHRRTGDKPFNRIEDVISAAELSRLLSNYRTISDLKEGSSTAT